MDTLPSEIIGIIFKNLDNLEYCLVNKYWNKMLLKNFPLTIQLSKDPARKFNKILKSDRKFSIFRFNYYNCINEPPNLIELVQKGAQKLKPDIKKLEAIRSYIRIEQWMAIIKELQNLDHIKVIATRLIFPQDPNDPIDPAEDFILRDEDIPELNSLRSVFMKDCSELFFKFLAKSRLHEINVSLKRESVLQELLLSQPHIRRIQNITPFNQNIFRTVWELEHLVELDLNLEKTDFEGFEHLQGVNLSLQKLTLLGETESISYLKIILSIFPNIVELSFNNNHLLNQELMEYINANHQRVTKIRFNSCSRDIFQFLRLQNLKFLEISENQKMDSWLQFIQNHPDLEAMVLKDELLTNEHFQLFTSKMENLRTLELHHDELLTRDILDIAFSKDCKLKILRLKDIFGRQGIGFTVEDQQKLKETDNNLLLFVKQKN